MDFQYKPKFTVPEGFLEILYNFTKDILIDQPLDILEYGAKYFEDKANNNNVTINIFFKFFFIFISM